MRIIFAKVEHISLYRYLMRPTLGKHSKTVVTLVEKYCRSDRL